jgi:hypothetical protein
MGFLDELKQEAEAIKAGEARQQDEAQSLDHVFQTSLKPAMKRILDYFNQVVEQLNVVSPEARVSYEIEGVCRLDGLQQSEYKISVENPEEPRSFTLSYTCSREGKVRFEKQGKRAAEFHRNYMRSHGLDFNYKMGVDGCGVFVLQPWVPVSFTFEADVQNKMIRLRIRNMHTLGAVNYSFSPDKIDDTWLEELAKRVVRRPNRFDELVGNAMPEEARRRLQRELEQIRMQRARELLDRAQEEAAERKKGLLGRLRRKED